MLQRLSDEERSQLYGLARHCWAEDDGTDLGRIRRVKLAVKSKLVGIGWEVILINLAIQFLVPILIKWLSSLVKDPGFEPPCAMPVLFAVPGAVEEDDE